jgi:hypothetical protein
MYSSPTWYALILGGRSVEPEEASELEEEPDLEDELLLDIPSFDNIARMMTASITINIHVPSGIEAAISCCSNCVNISCQQVPRKDVLTI